MAKVIFLDHHAHEFYLAFALLNIVATCLYFQPIYYTYWSFVVFMVFLVSATLDILTTQFGFFCFFNSLFVMIGVIVMSIARSEDDGDMLSQIAASNGLVVYGLQTYAVHYLPVAVMGCSLPLPRSDDLEQLAASLASAVSLFVFYLSVFDPREVYGVAINSTESFAIAGIFFVVATAGFAVVGYH